MEKEIQINLPISSGTTLNIVDNNTDLTSLRNSADSIYATVESVYLEAKSSTQNGRLCKLGKICGDNIIEDFLPVDSKEWSDTILKVRISSDATFSSSFDVRMEKDSTGTNTGYCWCLTSDDNYRYVKQNALEVKQTKFGKKRPDLNLLILMFILDCAGINYRNLSKDSDIIPKYL